MLYKVEINPNNTNTSHSKIINMIENNTKVLDVGCAYGDLGEYLSNNKNCTMFGIECDQQSVEFARNRNIYQDIFHIDLNNLDSVNKALDHYKDYFDYIICGDVLEHLYNPLSVLNNLKQYLNNDGFFVVSLPNIAHGGVKLNILKNKFNYTECGLIDKTHIRFFTFESIQKLIADANFEVMGFDYVLMPFENHLEKALLNDHLPEIVDYIKKTDESFIYQYIFKIKKSSLATETLLNQNLNKVKIFLTDEVKIDINKPVNKTKSLFSTKIGKKFKLRLLLETQ